jgi:imidazolonepropionase-like amidohydrolase
MHRPPHVSRHLGRAQEHLQWQTARRDAFKWERVICRVDSGMTPMQALMTETVSAAEAGGIQRPGGLAAGMAADVAGMSRSPLEDMHAVLDVGFVMRDGILVKMPGDTAR